MASALLARFGLAALGAYIVSRTTGCKATPSTALPKTRLQGTGCGMGARRKRNTPASSVVRSAAQCALARTCVWPVSVARMAISNRSAGDSARAAGHSDRQCVEAGIQACQGQHQRCIGQHQVERKQGRIQWHPLPASDGISTRRIPVTGVCGVPDFATALLYSVTNSEASLQAPSAVGVRTYLGSTNAPVVFRFDDYRVTNVATP